MANKRFLSVGRRIRDLRSQKKYTQQSFADKIGFTLDKMRNIEQGRTSTSVLDLEKIADILGCDIDYLLLRQDEPNRVYKHFSDETGLSRSAVEKIKTSEPIFITALDWLICNPDLIRSINSAALYSPAEGYIEYSQKGADGNKPMRIFINEHTLYQTEKFTVTEEAAKAVDGVRSMYEKRKSDARVAIIALMGKRYTVVKIGDISFFHTSEGYYFIVSKFQGKYALVIEYAENEEAAKCNVLKHGSCFFLDEFQAVDDLFRAMVAEIENYEP